MTATRHGPDDIDTGARDGDSPAVRRGGWMVDVATRRVFRVTPKGEPEGAPAQAGRETGEGDQA